MLVKRQTVQRQQDSVSGIVTELGNLHRNAKGKFKWRSHKANTKDLCRDGSDRSSDDVLRKQKTAKGLNSSVLFNQQLAKG